jgi:Skp family chaperone for outer membrane proteins
MTDERNNAENEIISPVEEVQITEDPQVENQEDKGAAPQKSKEKKKLPLCRICIDGIFCLAIIALFILHFCHQPKQTISPYSPLVENITAGTGEIVFVNVDTINKHYKLVSILEDDIKAEQAKQETIFANRQKAFENKAMQFQKNYESGILSNVQVQNAQQQLMGEKENLERDYEQVASNLQNRQVAALQQIADSLYVAVKRINSVRNASFVFSYGYASQLIVADPTRDITSEVLNEMNKTYK